MLPARTHRPTRTPRRGPLASLAALTLAAGLLAGCSDGGQDADDAGATASPSDSASPSETASDTATAEPSESPTATDETDDAGDTTAVPVYYVVDGPQGPRLVREFHRVDALDYLTAAADQLTQTPDDPDYTSLVPQGSFLRVTLNEETNTLDVRLPDDAWTTASGLTRKQARMALQQVVYTVQGAARTRAAVKVYVRNAPEAGPLFGIDTSDGVREGGFLRTLHLVNVTAPAEGDTVSGTFTAKGVASSFEATVPWEIRQGEEVVLDGFTTASGWVDKLYPWEAEVDVSSLEPGEYTFVAMTDDPTGGAEGPGPSEDTKTIVVE